MSQDYSLIHVFEALKKWKKQILLATIIVTALSIIISLLLSNYYKSTAIAYPANPALANPIPIGSYERSVDIYGNNDDLDRLLTIATSSDYSYKIIDHFDLYNHYNINKDNPKSRFQVYSKFWDLFSVTKTKYDALELSVEDMDPTFAQEVAKYGFTLLNDEAQRLIKSNQSLQAASLEYTIQDKAQRQKSISDSLTVLRELSGIYNANAQGTILTELFSTAKAEYIESQAKLAFYKANPISRDSTNKYRAKTTGLEKKVESLKDEMTNYNNGFSKVSSYEKQEYTLQNQLAFDSERASQIKSTLSSPFAALLVVQEATLPTIKSRPARSLIVLGTAFFTFFFACLIALLLESYKKLF
jgi:capsule polysaccharide export protein KpsE/RkpR